MPANSDPFRVIAAEPPRFSAREAVRVAHEHYGMVVTASELVSERDRNFRLRASDSREFVLKIASGAEDRVVTDFQVQALEYIDQQGTDIATPRVVPTLDGRSSFVLQSESGPHVARVVTFLPGVLLAGQPLTPELCRNLGIYAAKLGQALRGFEHPGSNPSLIWNMQQAPRAVELAHHIPDPLLREQVVACLGRFATALLPLFPALRRQVVHNDLNPENVLVEARDPSRIAGVIDFGDMTEGPLVADVAVAASYMREFEDNPLARIAEFVAAYHSVTPLERHEIDLIYDLVLVRLATTVSVLQWRIATRGADDPYLNNSQSAESTAARFFEILAAIPPEHARQTLRQACASAEVGALRQTAPGL